MEEKVRSSKCSGVTVTVKKKEKTFDLVIHIDVRTNLKQKRNSPEFLIKFRALKAGTSMVTQTPIHMEFTDLAYNSQADIRKHFKENFIISKDICCKISMTPKFYLPKALFKKTGLSNKKKAPKSKFTGICGIDTNMRVTSRSYNSISYNGKGPIPYAKNNIFKPYQGGAVSPK